MKPIKAWAVVQADGHVYTTWAEALGVYSKRLQAKRMACDASTIVRVEIREVPKKVKR